MMHRSKKQLLATLLWRIIPSVLVEPPLTRYRNRELTVVRKEILRFLDSWAARLRGNVLEVGAGPFPYAKSIVNSRCNYIATDYTGTDNIDVIVDACHLVDKFDKNYCDFVICVDVLEHLEEPRVVLGQIYDILKEGGILLLTTPFNYKLHNNEKVKDYWRFSEDGLRKLLLNFEILQLNSCGHKYFPYCYTVAARKPYRKNEF